MATTVFEKPIGTEVETLKSQIGTLSSLTTSAKSSAVAAINEVNSKLASTTINPTTSSNFSLVYSHSHYITNKVVHISCRLKVLSIPSTTDQKIITIPSGMTINPAGMVIPAYKSSGEWASPNLIIYCYMGTTGFTIHSSDISVNDFILIDHIVRIQ